MPLYTFLMEYAGGTYISQVKAPSPKAACKKWAMNLDVSQIDGFDKKAQESLPTQIRDASVVPIDGVLNVWCVTARVRGKLALINLVLTQG